MLQAFPPRGAELTAQDDCARRFGSDGGDTGPERRQDRRLPSSRDCTPDPGPDTEGQTAGPEAPLTTAGAQGRPTSTEGLAQRKAACCPPPGSLRKLMCGADTDPHSPSSGCGWRAGPAARPCHRRPLAGHDLCCGPRATPTSAHRLAGALPPTQTPTAEHSGTKTSRKSCSQEWVQHIQVAN